MVWPSRRGRHDRRRHRRLFRRSRLAGVSHAVCSAAAAGSLSCARRGLMLMLDAWPSAGASPSQQLPHRVGTCHTLGDGTTAAGSLDRRYPPVPPGCRDV